MAKSEAQKPQKKTSGDRHLRLRGEAFDFVASHPPPPVATSPPRMVIKIERALTSGLNHRQRSSAAHPGGCKVAAVDPWRLVEEEEDDGKQHEEKEKKLFQPHSG